MPYRTKEAAVEAILGARSEIEDCCCNGTTSALMTELSMPTSKVYKEWCIAKNQERIDETSQHDMVGFAIQATENKELDDRHLVGMAPNELNPSAAKFEIYASDLHPAHIANSGDTFDCPIIAPKGQKAKDILPEIPNPSGAKASDHDAVIEDLAQCCRDFDTIEDLAEDQANQIDVHTDSSDPEICVVDKSEHSGKGLSDYLRGVMSSEHSDAEGIVTDVVHTGEVGALLPVDIVISLLESANIKIESIDKTRAAIQAYLDKGGQTLDNFLKRIPMEETITAPVKAVTSRLREAAEITRNQLLGMFDMVHEKAKDVAFSRHCMTSGAPLDLDTRLDQAEEAVLSAPDLTQAAASETHANVDPKEMEEAYKKQLSDANSMVASYRDQLQAANADLQHARAEAAHNEKRLHRAVNTVKAHLSGMKYKIDYR